MAKRKKKKSKFPLLYIVIALVAAASVYVMFFDYPESAKLTEYLESTDYNVVETQNDNFITEAFFPEGGETSIVCIDGNLEEALIVYYFDDYEHAKAYYDDLKADLEDNEDSDAVISMRGTVVFYGTEATVKDVRWKIWLI